MEFREIDQTAYPNAQNTFHCELHARVVHAVKEGIDQSDQLIIECELPQYSSH
jgi:hypothetical protein